MKSILFVCIFLALTSCISQKEKPNSALKSGEGFVLMNIDCPSVVKKVHILRSGRTADVLSEFSPDMRLACNGFFTNSNGLAFFKLKEGSYFFGTIGEATSFYINEAKAYKFSVVPGKVNYIGDFKIDHVGDTLSNNGPFKTVTQNVSINVENGKEKAIREFSNQYPELHKTVPIHIAVAKK